MDPGVGTRRALPRTVCQQRVHLAKFGLEVEHFGPQVATRCSGRTASVLLVLDPCVAVLTEGTNVVGLPLPCLLY